MTGSRPRGPVRKQEVKGSWCVWFLVFSFVLERKEGRKEGGKKGRKEEITKRESLKKPRHQKEMRES